MSVAFENICRFIENLSEEDNKLYYETINNSGACTPSSVFLVPSMNQKCKHIYDYFQQCSFEFRGIFGASIIMWRHEGFTFQEIFAGKMRTDNMIKLSEKVKTRPELLQMLV